MCTLARAPGPGLVPRPQPTVRRTVQLPAGVSTITDTLAVSGADLWWPNGYGTQPLYTVNVSLAVALPPNTNDAPGAGPKHGRAVHAVRRIGFRSVNMETRHANATVRQLHRYTVNGVRIFAKGASHVWTALFIFHTHFCFMNIS